MKVVRLTGPLHGEPIKTANIGNATVNQTTRV